MSRLHFKKSSKKKGALDVSINSIVVIVFAVTMLGLGLAFIKGYFEKAQNTINLDDVSQVPDATISNPISTSSDSFALEKGKTNTFKVKFYNNHADGRITFALGDCVVGTSAVTAGSNYFGITVAPQTVDTGNSKEFLLKLSVIGTGNYLVTSKQEYICNLDAKVDGSSSTTPPLEEKQLTLKIK